ncbi:MAG: CD225/dispanin family protein [Paludibacteraceae bacterium]|nr:CD225/dispanin family protein [Paludibacteraceae bacterium]MBP5480548.1 CD225/dispanin family protein [Paludibacteraceae bacterium]
MQTCPKNYLVQSILATIFCCLPIGVFGILKAIKVNKLFDQGDYEGALEASKSAKSCARWAVIVGILVGVVVMILFFVFGVGRALISQQ